MRSPDLSQRLAQAKTSTQLAKPLPETQADIPRTGPRRRSKGYLAASIFSFQALYHNPWLFCCHYGLGRLQSRLQDHSQSWLIKPPSPRRPACSVQDLNVAEVGGIGGLFLVIATNRCNLTLWKFAVGDFGRRRYDLSSPALISQDLSRCTCQESPDCRLSVAVKGVKLIRCAPRK